MTVTLTVTLLSLVFLFQGTSDLYASSMPEMMQYFATNQSGIQLTIIIFLISYGVSQFIWVYFSERYSRKTIIILNLLIFIFASCLAAKANSLSVLYISRILQGVAISALNLNVKAMPLEVFNQSEAKIFYIYFALIWGAGGTIAPWIGSNIQHFFNWKHNFVALAIYAGIIFFFALYFIPNQNREINKHLTNLKNYRIVLANAGFLNGIIAQSCTLSMFLTFNYYMSFYTQNIKHYSELTFGYISFGAGFSFILGCLLFRFMINKINSNRLSIVCSSAAILLAIILMGVNYLETNASMLFNIILTCLIIFCSGVMASENIGITMMFFPKLASVASCLHTAIHFLTTSLFMFVLSLFSNFSLLVISSFYFLLTLLFFITNQHCYFKLKQIK